MATRARMRAAGNRNRPGRAVAAAALPVAVSAVVVLAGIGGDAAAEVDAAVAACAARGAAILAGNAVRSADQSQLSRYDPSSSRCYVELLIKTTAAAAGSDRYASFLYDGVSGDLLAFAEVRDGDKSGRVFDLSHATTSFENSGWDDATDYIRQIMAPDRGD